MATATPMSDTWGTDIMIELELATTDQILDELGKRPIKFVHV